MKKIGFIDYYISEWHANNYPSWIEEACGRLGYEYKLAYAWAELDASPKYGETTEQWCEKFGAKMCATMDELCEKSDVIVILAPSDPDTHLRYAEAALKYGKPTYIDKTFSPDLETAKKIFALAEKYDTPFFSTSALRYGEELETPYACREVITTGGGSNLPEYIVHQAEMVVKKLGLGAERIKAEQYGSQVHMHVEYGDGRVATMIYSSSMPFTVSMWGGQGTKGLFREVRSAYFVGLIEDMMNFFETGKVSFDTRETLEVMKLREGAVKVSEICDGRWLELPEI